MRIMTRSLMIIALFGAIFTAPPNLEAYGYQPDSEGYAYTDSVTSATSSIIMPIAVVSFAVILGVILYTTHRSSSDHTSRFSEGGSNHNHQCGHCGH